MSKRQGAKYPNQREYRVYKKAVPNAPRIQVDKADADAAFQILTRIEFYIWMDIMSNREDFTWGFSPAAYEKRLGISVSAARKAFGALVEKGFAESVGSNGYKVYGDTANPEYDHIYDVEKNNDEEVDKRWD